MTTTTTSTCNLSILLSFPLLPQLIHYYGKEIIFILRALCKQSRSILSKEFSQIVKYQSFHISRLASSPISQSSDMGEALFLLSKGVVYPTIVNYVNDGGGGNRKMIKNSPPPHNFSFETCTKECVKLNEMRYECYPNFGDFCTSLELEMRLDPIDGYLERSLDCFNDQFLSNCLLKVVYRRGDEEEELSGQFLNDYYKHSCFQCESSLKTEFLSFRGVIRFLLPFSGCGQLNGIYFYQTSQHTKEEDYWLNRCGCIINKYPKFYVDVNEQSLMNEYFLKVNYCRLRITAAFLPQNIREGLIFTPLLSYKIDTPVWVEWKIGIVGTLFESQTTIYMKGLMEEFIHQPITCFLISTHHENIKMTKCYLISQGVKLWQTDQLQEKRRRIKARGNHYQDDDFTSMSLIGSETVQLGITLDKDMIYTYLVVEHTKKKECKPHVYLQIMKRMNIF